MGKAWSSYNESVAGDRKRWSRRTALVVFCVAFTLPLQFSAALLGQGYYAVYQKYLIGWPELGFPSAMGDDAVSKGRVMLALGTLLALVALPAIALSVRRLRDP